eukprot:2166459-Pyramimonas_sp.AAC.2
MSGSVKARGQLRRSDRGPVETQRAGESGRVGEFAIERANVTRRVGEFALERANVTRRVGEFALECVRLPARRCPILHVAIAGSVRGCGVMIVSRLRVREGV